MQLTRVMTLTFLRIFSRDRQAIFFTLFFPLVLMGVFGLVGNSEDEPFSLGIVDLAGTPLAAEFIDTLGQHPRFEISSGENTDLRESLIAGDLDLMLVLPAAFQDRNTQARLTLLVDAAQVRELDLLMPILQQALVDIERSLRGESALFSLEVEDVKARPQNYLSFLIPGLLAFTIMQISIAGSGFNIVEFRRKGILKRLFVTPVQPRDFIGGLVISRTLICLIQVGVLLGIAFFLFDISIAGNLMLLFFSALLGTALFLSMGFCMGSLAHTQQAIMAIGNLVTFPQMFLSGIFYPIDILPTWLQPLAEILPLSFLASALRELMVDGAGFMELLPDLAGLLVWSIICLFLAVRLFVWKEVAA